VSERVEHESSLESGGIRGTNPHTQRHRASGFAPECHGETETRFAGLMCAGANVLLRLERSQRAIRLSRLMARQAGRNDRRRCAEGRECHGRHGSSEKAVGTTHLLIVAQRRLSSGGRKRQEFQGQTLVGFNLLCATISRLDPVSSSLPKRKSLSLRHDLRRRRRH